MKPVKVQVVGAGLAGLSAALKLAREGVRVEVSEASAQAGGRCRSYFDPQLGLTIDNGNHLVLSGNRAVMQYLGSIGAEDRLAGPDRAEFDFADVRTGRRWTVRPNEGPLPWWVLSKARRVPGTNVLDYAAIARLLSPPKGARIGEVIACKGPLWERLLGPFLLAALNTDPETGAATLAGAVIRETLAKGGRAYRPRIAEPALSAAFVDPALEALERAGASVRLGRRLRQIELGAERAARLVFSDGPVELAPDEVVVLALPPWAAQDLLPGLSAPDEFCAILNGHFRLDPPTGLAPMVGVIGGTVEWVFTFEDRISVTVSGADRLIEEDRRKLAEMLWRDVAAVHGLSPEPPPWQIVKEKRATFAATPEQDAKRPEARTRWRNLILAGDWIQTGLPATIEGALRSGATAAQFALTAGLV